MSRYTFGQRVLSRARRDERIFVNKIFAEEGDKMVTRSSADPSRGSKLDIYATRFFLCCFHIVTLFLGDKIDTGDCRTGYYNGSVTGDTDSLFLLFFPFGKNT